MQDSAKLLESETQPSTPQYDSVLELGVTVLLETPAKKILMEDRKVAGVLAVDKNGEDVEIRCKAAVIATGGTGCNPDFIKHG